MLDDVLAVREKLDITLWSVFFLVQLAGDRAPY